MTVAGSCMQKEISLNNYVLLKHSQSAVVGLLTLAHNKERASSLAYTAAQQESEVCTFHLNRSCPLLVQLLICVLVPRCC